LLIPVWPVKDMVASVTIRLQDGRRRLARVRGAHPCPTFRPLSERVKLKVTTACSLSENENVVPTGGRLV
jgi:hypothetical protein